MSLDNLRKQIDDLDTLIIRSIAERMKVAGQIGREKKESGVPVEDKGRENIVLDKVRDLALTENLNPAEIQKIYQRIISISKEAQGVTVAFQGEIGAYSEEAAYQYFGPTARLKPCENLEDVFQAVEQGEIQYGLVPVENSLEGSISRTYDLLLDSVLKVSGETELGVIHCLIGLPESQIDSIKEIYSHSQALGQCKVFLGKMKWKLTATYDTAGSVKIIKENRYIDKAAIASARAAEVYGMKVLVKGIEDNQNNITRFFILSKQEAVASDNDKTSIVFTVKHKPGALYDALQKLAAKKINLTKIESRPTRQKPWEYNFYVDFDGRAEDKMVREALQDLDDVAVFVKILGSYPIYPHNLPQR
jgi:chorismate mutase/prephenate dehydratase